MHKISIKAYAVKHKLSIFNVMKMVKSGKVKSEICQEDGREVTYILYDEKSEQKVKEQIVPLEAKNMFQINEALQNLTKEVELLRKEVEQLKHK